MSDTAILLAINGALLFIRVLVALRLTPFLGGRPLPLLPLMGLSLSLVFVLLPGLGPMEATPRASMLIQLVLKEVLVGASFGLMARIVFSVFESTGALIGLAAHTIPSAGREEGYMNPLVGLYTFLGIGAFLLMDGHHGMLSALAGSFRWIPLDAAFDGDLISSKLIEGAVAVFAGAFTWAVMIATPVFMAGLMADVFGGLVMQMAPGMGQGSGTGSLRVVATQVVMIATLGAGVTAGIAFLQSVVE
jgi:flagellar biosynthetic protein FliR